MRIVFLRRILAFSGKYLPIITILLISSTYPLNAHTDAMEERKEVSIEDRTGKFIPLDLDFTDENGKVVSIKELFKTPVILSPVYFSCPNVCNLLLEEIARLVDKMEAEPGRDYTIITFSFDENDKPEKAFEKKMIFQKIIRKKIPDDSWKFLTGDRESIKRLTDAIGFNFKRKGNEFIHPVSLVVLSSDGKIIRYVPGKALLPFDLKMAIAEASEGRTGATINKVLLLCYSYDPEARRYVLNITRIGGVIILLSLAGFSIFLLRNRGSRS